MLTIVLTVLTIVLTTLTLLTMLVLTVLADSLLTVLTILTILTALQCPLLQGILVNYSDPDGHTALWFAVQSRNRATVECLLQNGANPICQTGHRYTHHAGCDTAGCTVTALGVL